MPITPPGSAVILETLRALPMRICAYCWMPNHWHLVLWPEKDGQLSTFMQRVTNRHTQRWQRAKRRVGYGHLYQGRFKSFPVESDDHFYSLVRYVERNACGPALVARAEDWPWCSLSRRTRLRGSHSVKYLAPAATVAMDSAREPAADRRGTGSDPSIAFAAADRTAAKRGPNASPTKSAWNRLSARAAVPANRQQNPDEAPLHPENAPVPFSASQ